MALRRENKLGQLVARFEGGGTGQRGFEVAGERLPSGVDGSGVAILIVIGTRPECIKLAALIGVIRAQGGNLRLLVSGQHPETCRRALAEFGIEADSTLDVVQDGTLSQRLRRLTAQIFAFIGVTNIGLVVVQGDTLTTLAGAIAARRHGIALAHIEAGLRTGSRSIPFPEEWIRNKVTPMATFHFSPSRIATANLRNEGVQNERIFEVGNTGIDTLRRYAGIGWDGKSTHDEILISVHRRECRGQLLRDMCNVIRRLSVERPWQTIRWVLPPNPESWIVVRRQLGGIKNVRIDEPLAYCDMLHAYRRASLILTDSGGIQEDLPYLGRRFLLIRERTERPEPLALGYGIMVGFSAESILSAARRALTQANPKPCGFLTSGLYGDGRASVRIAGIINRLMQRGAP